mgnify:FL=1
MLGYVGVQLNYVGLCRGTVELCWVMSGYSYVYMKRCLIWQSLIEHSCKDSCGDYQVENFSSLFICCL